MVIRFGKKENQERRGLLESTEAVASASVRENAAFQHVRENIEELNGKAGIEDKDLIFLKGLMDSPILNNLLKVQDKLEEQPAASEPVALGNTELVRDLIIRCNRSRTREVRELAEILCRPHIRALIDTHDEIGRVTSDKTPREHTNVFGDMHGETIRMVGLRKNPGEPLGLTVEQDDNGNLVVARILGGGAIDRQGLLHVGDVILEVNGEQVDTPEDLQLEIARAKDSVTLKIGPGTNAQNAVAQNSTQVKDGNVVRPGKKLTCYMRALFDYDPKEDSLLPCREIGLTFERGDILQIVDQRDPNWWQAKKVGNNGPAGLIPSLELEERRKAYVAPEADYVHKISICGARISKKKRKIIYQSKSNNEFDKADLLLYEEVTRMPPFKRKTLVLIGSQGVGRRTLKNRLVNSDPERFGAIVPHTSRPPRVLEENGRGYWFVSRETMEQEIKENHFLEYGEHNGHLYGTHFDSIREVISQGKMCVLDCSPVALKLLHNSTEFLPYVIFIAAPGMEHLKTMYAQDRSLGYSSNRNLTFDRQSSIRYSSRRARTLESLASLYEDDDLKKTVEESACLQRTYDKYVDQVIINEDFDVTFRKVVEALETLASEHQWVPVNWIY